MKIFCISIFEQNFKKLKNLNLTPVGLGKNKFSKLWLTDKGIKNISRKNLNFGEYTFHHKLWKNQKLISNSNDFFTFFLLTVNTVEDPTGPLISFTASIKDFP